MVEMDVQLSQVWRGKLASVADVSSSRASTELTVRAQLYPDGITFSISRLHMLKKKLLNVSVAEDSLPKRWPKVHKIIFVKPSMYKLVEV